MLNSERQSSGIIGLGLLGTAIGRRLLGAGFAIVGFDVDPAACARLLASGGLLKSSPDDVFADTQTIILSLPNSEIVEQLLIDVSDSLRPDQTIINTTTGDPDQMVRIAGELANRGLRYVEANVAGSSVQLAEGQATLLLGGDQQNIAANAELLAALSPKQFHVGGAGFGARFKLVHNLILGLHRAVFAEGLSFAESLGFDPSLTLEILRQTPASSQAMETKGEKMVQREYSPQAKLSQHLKDVRLILSLADRSGANTPLSQLHCELLRQAEALGYGDLDNSSIREVYLESSEETPS